MAQQQHWEKVYTGKSFTEVSWYQPTPQVSLDFLKELAVPTDAAIIDVGAGDSYFVDHLLLAGYTDITVLDISSVAIEKAKQRLGERASRVNWIVSDITEFIPARKYDYWHDRAAFHFLTTGEEITSYLAVANNAMKEGGKMLIGTFSENGPEKCSGLPVKKYSETALTSTLKKWFKKIRCIHTDHQTPFNTIQQFIFCSFQKSLA